jgi:hypothetical protein
VSICLTMILGDEQVRIKVFHFDKYYDSILRLKLAYGEFLWTGLTNLRIPDGYLLNVRNNWISKNESVRCNYLPSILWNPNIYYNSHTIQPLFSILSQINPVYALRFYLFKISFDVILPSTSRFYKLTLFSNFTNKTLHVFLFSTISAGGTR